MVDHLSVVVEVVEVLQPHHREGRSRPLRVRWDPAWHARRELGDRFSPEMFEQSMYSGHISYELSMTDGHYAPEPAETWIAEFRKFPRTKYNDAPAEVIAAFGRYQQEMAKTA